MSAGRALRGDEQALFERHSKRLVRTVQRMLAIRPEIAEEACSFAWLQLLRTQPEREAIFAWLRVVAINEAFRLLRKDRNVTLTDRVEEAGDLAQRPASGSDAGAVDAHAALELVAQLPERQRRIFCLHLAGFSYCEIADRTGDSRRTVERQLLRAGARLRKMEQEGESWPRGA